MPKTFAGGMVLLIAGHSAQSI